MKHYARSQPGEIWHLLDPEPVWLVTLCGKGMGENPKERHTDDPEAVGGNFCLRCVLMAHNRSIE